MGQQHVSLNIGDDGLVKSVGHDMGGSYEIETPKYEQLEINFPKVDGQGQSIYETCIQCGKETTTLKSTLDTPNDAELGAKVRRQYFENKS